MDTERGTNKKKRPLTGSAQRFRHIFEHSPAMVYLSDTAGFILDMNEAGVTMLGYDAPEEVLGLEAAHHLYAEPGDRLRFLETIEQTGSVQDFETRFRRRDGTIVDFARLPVDTAWGRSTLNPTAVAASKVIVDPVHGGPNQ